MTNSYLRRHRSMDIIVLQIITDVQMIAGMCFKVIDWGGDKLTKPIP